METARNLRLLQQWTQRFAQSSAAKKALPHKPIATAYRFV